MLDFDYFTPTKVVFGKGKEKDVGNLICLNGGKKVLLHYGSGSVYLKALRDVFKNIP